MSEKEIQKSRLASSRDSSQDLKAGEEDGHSLVFPPYYIDFFCGRTKKGNNLPHIRDWGVVWAAARYNSASSYFPPDLVVAGTRLIVILCHSAKFGGKGNEENDLGKDGVRACLRGQMWPKYFFSSACRRDKFLSLPYPIPLSYVVKKYLDALFVSRKELGRIENFCTEERHAISRLLFSRIVISCAGNGGKKSFSV